MITKRHTFAVLAVLASLPARADIIAFDLLDSSSRNLAGYTNPFSGAFASAEDGFQVYRRGNAASIPSALLDDTVTLQPGDRLGIVGEADRASFFGVVDTDNADNVGPVSARWDFVVSGFAGLDVSIDMAAMGDFEASDWFRWSWSVDGGAWHDLFESIVDGAATQDYVLAGGSFLSLADPLTVDGLLLDNRFQSISGPLPGIGDRLSLQLTARTNGGSEAIAFRNIVVSGDSDTVAVPEPGALLLFATGLLGLSRVRRRIARLRTL